MKLSPPNYLLIKQAGSVKGHAKVINFSNLSVTMSNGGEAVVSGAGAATNYFFSNSNGVTFGTNVSTVTASVRTNYAGTNGAITGGSITVDTNGVSINLPAYLTTAALSQDSSKYAGTAGAITGGSITVNTSGVSVNLPAYLTTAAQSQDSSNYAGTNGAITGGSITVNTSGVSVNLPNYLTTAALSQDSSKYAGTNGAITGGSITVNTDGVSVNLPAYLTTAQPVGPYLTTAALSQDSSKYAGTNGAITGGSITVNTNGVSINLPTYLTTAALSQDSSKYAGTNGAITGGSITVNTAGVSVNLPAYLTTAALSQDSSKYAGTNGAITGGSITVNTSGVSINLPAYLTTAMQSASSSVFAKTGFTTTSTTGSNIVGTHDTAGLSVGIPNYLTTAQSPGAYLTTAALSQDSSKYAGTSTGMTGGSVTLNTAGIAINLPAYLTTAALSADSSKYAGTSTGMTGGSVTLNTAGIAINLPAYLTTAALSGDTTKYAGIGETVGTTAGSDLAMTVNTAGVSIGYPKWLTTAMASDATMGGNINMSAGTTSTNASAFTFSNSNSISFGIGTGASAGVITASMAMAPFLSYFANMPYYPNVSLPTSTADSNTFQVFPITIPSNISIGYLRLAVIGIFTTTTIATSAVNNATGASTAFSQTMAMNAVLYTVGTGANSRSLQYVYSTSAGLTWAVSVSQASTSNASRQSFTQRFTFPAEGFTTATTSTQYSTTATNGPITSFGGWNLDGNRFLDIPFATSLSAGNYWMAVNRITGSVGGKNNDFNYKTYGVNQSNISLGVVGVATNVSNCAFQIGLGSWTTNAAQTTSSIAFASISASTSYWLPYVQFINQA